MNNENSQILIGDTTPIPSVDQDQKEIDQRIDSGLLNYQEIEIIDNIGKDTFENIYRIEIKDILKLPDEYLQIFCEKILDKIENVYNFSFPSKKEFYTKEDIKLFMEFLEFLHFKNLDFLIELWEGVVPTIFIDIKKFSIENRNKIINRVSLLSNKYLNNMFIFLFLRTYFKDGILSWIVYISDKQKPQIELGIRERK